MGKKNDKALNGRNLQKKVEPAIANIYLSNALIFRHLIV